MKIGAFVLFKHPVLVMFASASTATLRVQGKDKCFSRKPFTVAAGDSLS